MLIVCGATSSAVARGSTVAREGCDHEVVVLLPKDLPADVLNLASAILTGDEMAVFIERLAEIRRGEGRVLVVEGSLVLVAGETENGRCRQGSRGGPERARPPTCPALGD